MFVIKGLMIGLVLSERVAGYKLKGSSVVRVPQVSVVVANETYIGTSTFYLKSLNSEI